MAIPYKFYLEYMHKQTGYRASWDPGRPLKIGFIGKLDPFGVFSVYSSLDKEGITMDSLTGDSTLSEDYTSSSEVDIALKASGTAPVAGSFLTEADAGFSIEFKSKNAIVFKTSGQKNTQITNLAEVEKGVLGKYNAKNWDKDWLIVTELVHADTSTIIISNSSSGKLELKAKGNVGTGSLTLTNASLGLTSANEKGSTIKFIAQDGLTPLYKVMGIQHPLFSKTKLATKELKAPEGQGKHFVEQDFDPAELSD